MSKFECPVVKIRSIDPIANADTIEVAVVGEYRCVVKKNEFKTNELAVYLPEGALVPEWIQKELNVLGRLAGPDKNRIKSIRLKGVLSQGLLISMNSPVWSFNGTDPKSLDEGANLSTYLGITKYEPPIPPQFSGDLLNIHGKTIGYDIENLKKYPDVLKPGELVCMTEKLHGCADYDTIVDTVEFDEIKIGDLVRKKPNLCHIKSFNHRSGQIEYCKIIGYSEQENNNDWFEIVLDNETKLILTGNHRIWITDLQCYRRVDELDGTEDLLFSI